MLGLVALYNEYGMDIPADINVMLMNNLAARQIFNKLSPSHQNEYIRWVTEAKQISTRQRRIEKMVAMLLSKEN